MFGNLFFSPSPVGVDLEHMPVYPFIVFGPDTKELMVVPACKYEIFLSPVFNFLGFTVLLFNQTYTIIPFIQASCVDSVLFDNHQIGFLASQFTKIVQVHAS